MKFLYSGLLMLLCAACSSDPALNKQAGLASAPKVLTPETLADHPEASPYDEAATASDLVSVTFEKAKTNGHEVILVMGANWCHDSRGLAGWFEKDRFQDLLMAHYEVAYIDVGQKDRNIDIAQRYGIDEIVGTPTVLILNVEGQLRNSITAPTWRNAASRSEDEIYDYFEKFTDRSYHE